MYSRICELFDCTGELVSIMALWYTMGRNVVVKEKSNNLNYLSTVSKDEITGVETPMGKQYDRKG